MAQSFSAAVSDWARKSEARLAAVFHDAAQTVANEVRKPKSAGGRMPVDLGNLRRSLMASTTNMPSIKNSDTFADGDAQVKLVIAGAPLGSVIYLGFQAAYARRMEYGFVGQDKLGRTYNQAPNAFVRSTAQRWAQIVNESARSIQSRVESRA